MKKRDCRQRRIGGSWTGLFVAVALLGLTSPDRASCQDRAARKGTSFTVDVPLLVAKQFENVQGLIEQEDWPAALTALEEVTDEFPEALVAVGPRQFMNAVGWARLLTTRLPVAGRAAYRQQMDGWAGQQFQDAVNSHSEAGLWLLLQDAYASRFGDDALWTLGEWLWERGEVDSARRLWEQLIPFGEGPPGEVPPLLRYPDSEFAPAEVRARLVLCSIVEQNWSRANSELVAFRQLHPDDSGILAGRSGALSEILAELLAESEKWPQQTVIGNWPTFARDGRRNAPAAAQLALEGPQWMIPLAPLEVPNWQRSRPALRAAPPLGRYPVAVDGGLFFHDGVSIRAVRLADGRPRWPRGDETDIGDIYPPFNVLPIRPVLRPTVGVPRFTTTVHRGRLYALTGPSVKTLPEAGLRASPTRLVCLDVESGEGLLRWFQTADDLFPAGWMMTGTPVAAGERLYLPLLRTDPQLEPAVACLSAEDGSVIWWRSIGQALVEPLEGFVELGHQLLSVSDGRVYCSTDLGAIAALDAETGVVRWVTTYPSIPLEALQRSNEAANGLLPPVCAEGCLFVKPNDADEVMALDAASGTVRWRRRLPGRVVHLLGVRGTGLFASGDQLWALDADTGAVRWRFGFDDPAAFGAGRGAITGDRIFWTTHGDLFTVDLRTGRPVQRYPLQELLEVFGGNIILSHDRMIISGPDHLTAFGLAPATGRSVGHQAGLDSPK